MAGFFPSNGAGVMVVLALAGVTMAAAVAQGAEGAEPGHHVVGGDRGWDVASNIAEWSSGRVFTVGDSIWFAYSAGEESIVEVGSKEELDACDVGNPIRMYTDGLNEVALEGEGPRYFASGRPESCRGGLKLHVEVVEAAAQAPAPAAASAAVTTGGSEGAAVSGADAPSASGSHRRLRVSVLLIIVCVGVASLSAGLMINTSD